MSKMKGEHEGRRTYFNSRMAANNRTATWQHDGLGIAFLILDLDEIHPTVCCLSSKHVASPKG